MPDPLSTCRAIKRFSRQAESWERNEVLLTTNNEQFPRRLCASRTNMNTPTIIAANESVSALSLYHLLEPSGPRKSLSALSRLRTEDPVHWDPFLHAWVVTRYKDVVTVLYQHSAERTPTPEQLTLIGLPH